MSKKNSSPEDKIVGQIVEASRDNFTPVGRGEYQHPTPRPWQPPAEEALPFRTELAYAYLTQPAVLGRLLPHFDQAVPPPPADAVSPWLWDSRFPARGRAPLRFCRAFIEGAQRQRDQKLDEREAQARGPLRAQVNREANAGTIAGFPPSFQTRAERTAAIEALVSERLGGQYDDRRALSLDLQYLALCPNGVDSAWSDRSTALRLSGAISCEVAVFPCTDPETLWALVSGRLNLPGCPARFLAVDWALTEAEALAIERAYFVPLTLGEGFRTYCQERAPRKAQLPTL